MNLLTAFFLVIYYFAYGIVKYAPTPIGELLRFIVLKLSLKKLGWTSVRIRDGVTIHSPRRVRIGEHTTLNEWVLIDGEGEVEIGNWVRIGHRTSILSADHGFADKKIPIAKQDHKLSKITIEDDVWIGADVKILRGVRIGTGSVLAAGAVITHDIPSRSIAAGVPARVLKKR